jgi:hypothetical protein
MRQVVPYPTPALHQLHLFLVGFKDPSIGIGPPFIANDETVGERCDLERITNSGHWASLGYNIPEVPDQAENLFHTHGIWVSGLDPGYFPGDSPVHIVRVLFVNIPCGIFQGVFVNPNTCGQVVAFKITKGSLIGFIL